jgi:hypothetical protein
LYQPFEVYDLRTKSYFSLIDNGFGECEVADDTMIDPCTMARLRSENPGILELGIDNLPEGWRDIRGSIHYEPQRVFAIDNGYGDPGYVGVAIEYVRNPARSPPKAYSLIEFLS